MDFFRHQERARHRSQGLIVCFTLAVGLTILAMYAVVALLLLNRPAVHANGLGALWDARLFGGVAAGMVAVIGLAGLNKMRALSGGGSVVATSLGGRIVPPEPTDPDERKLRNVVEEMALASGVPVPEIYVLDEERGINAFAAGHSLSDAVVGVTRGAIQLLNRDELQGVIAHEFSHILQGDMRLNTRLTGIAFGLLGLTVLGRILVRTRSRKSPLPLVGLALIVIGFIGACFGRVIKGAVSRQRAFRADALAVQFTRYPEGLTGALKKIGGLAQGSRLEAPNAEEASHLFFSNGVRSSWFGLTATHPPLVRRIRRLEPGFDGRFPTVKLEASTEPPCPPVIGGLRRMPAIPGGAGVPPLLSPAVSLAGVGLPSAPHLDYVGDLLSRLPPGVGAAVREATGALALTYALLLSSDPQVQAAQIRHLAGSGLPEVLRDTERLVGQIGGLGERAKLPLLSLALPALRRLTREQYARFRSSLQGLIASDRQLDLFEFTLLANLRRHLDSTFNTVRKPVVQFSAFKPLMADCQVLFSALAHAGSEDPAARQRAFGLGLQQIPFPSGRFALLDRISCGLEPIDAALGHLDLASLPLKRTLLKACALAVAVDGLIQPGEAELLRAIGEALDCPIPPFIRLG